MSVTPRRFTRKQETVEAVHVTDDNVHDVAEWCDGEVVTELRTGLSAVDTGEGGIALVGEWVTRSDSGFFEAEGAGFEHGWQPAIPSTAQVTEYRLSLLPEDDDDWFLYVVTVIRARGGAWYVLRGTPSSPTNRFLHPDGFWRTGTWDTAPSYDLATAFRLADEALPAVAYHGTTAADVLAERGEAKP